ncbi:hypothetical protein [Actinoplanes sp. NPDC049265]|uniref:hypothetical protein n=1 Tax=Actinoplanes sp. NPDC049265 TaxID=3363902 RepID=UPI00371B7AE8
MSVTLIDLRRRDTSPPDRPDGRMLVLDEAETLLKHADVYRDLIGRPTVSGLICVAVGDAGPETLVDGVALAVPAALRPDGEARGAVVWAGDPHGLDWAPHAAPHVPESRRPALDGLIAALRVTEVFDAVLAAAAEMPGSVVGPAVRLAHGAAGGTAAGEVAAAAARSLCEPGEGGSPALPAAARRVDAEHDPAGPLLARPIAGHARDARRRVDDLIEVVRKLGTGWALVGPNRPTAVVGASMRESARATGAYQAGLDQLLGDMDGHIEEGRPPLTEVRAHGVAEPQPAREPEILTGLHELVDRRLGQDVTFPELAAELRAAAAHSAPQGVSAVQERVRALPASPGALPKFPRRPLSLWTLPLIALTCLAVVLLSGPGTDWLPMGLLLTLVWTVAGWVLLARRPLAAGEQGFGRSARGAFLTYGLSGLLGVAAGYALRQNLDPPRPPYPMALLGLLMLTAVVVAVRAWRAAVRDWSTRLPLARLRAAVTTMDDAAAEACVTEWQPMRRRRAIAGVAEAAADGVQAIGEVLDAQAADLFPPPRPRPAEDTDALPVVALPELFQVVRGDLVDLGRTALGPVWSAAGAPYRSADADVRREFGRLLKHYREHVDRHGVLSPFSPDADPGLRQKLMARIWNRSPAWRAALAGQPGDELTQLCHDGQLAYLSRAAEPRMIRFAPHGLLEVLRRDATDQRIADDPGVVWTRSSELVGVLRLLPLRPESIRHGWDGGTP